jgi:hypothetical protein
MLDDIINYSVCPKLYIVSGFSRHIALLYTFLDVCYVLVHKRKLCI